MLMSRFKRLVRVGEVKADSSLVLRKPIIATLEPMENRLVRYTISTDAEDRERDVVSQMGWELDAYRTNPVVLWAHNSSALPIGRCVDIGLKDGALKALVEYVPQDMPVVGELAEAVLRMSRQHFLSATSVGFRPLDFELAEDRDDGESWFPPINFLRQELMEFSVVSIPANPEALIDPAERTGAPAPTPEQIALNEAAAEAERAAQSEAEQQQRLAAIRAARRQRQLDARLVEIGR